MPVLVAIDTPAERSVSDTGWFRGTFDDDQPLERLSSGVISGGFAGFVNGIESVLRDADIVVCEHYVVFNRAGDPTPMLAEGVVRFLRPDVVLQRPTGYKTAVPDKVLKNMGFWSTTGHHADERSATRHALKYLYDKGHKPTLRKGWSSPST